MSVLLSILNRSHTSVIRGVVVGASAACAVAVTAITATAFDGAAAPSRSSQVTFESTRAWHDSISSYRRELDSTVRQNPDISGFSLENDTRSVMVYGLGATAPEQMRELIAHPPAGTSATWTEVATPLADLVAAVSDLSDPAIASVILDADYAGLTIFPAVGASDRDVSRAVESLDVPFEVDREQRQTTSLVGVLPNLTLGDAPR